MPVRRAASFRSISAIDDARLSGTGGTSRARFYHGLVIRGRARTVPALLVIALLTSCGPAGPSDGGEGPPALLVSDAPLLPTTTDALTPIDVETFDQLRAQVRGTPLVVNFWASWCDPCEEEMPMLAEAARTHDDQIQFLGVDILDTTEPARAFIERFDVPYPNVFDAMGDTRNAVGSIGQPVTVFYAADGSVVRKVDGQLTESELNSALVALLR
jgi:cytochrome c biogenesis protein CcmG, thiol:disulfide interchange protein DsbE